MHGAALATAATSGLAKELGHDGTCGNPLAQRVHVVAVRADNAVGAGEKLDEAGGDSFLAVVEVDEAEHLATVVHLRTHILESAAEDHVLVEFQRFLAGHRLRRKTIKGLNSHKQISTNYCQIYVPIFFADQVLAHKASFGAQNAH